MLKNIIFEPGNIDFRNQRTCTHACTFTIWASWNQSINHTITNMFADDTQLEASSDNVNVITNKLNHDLENVSAWLSANKLT